jgi:aspartyl protease family protein
MSRALALCAAAALIAATPPAWAQTRVALQGMLGHKALLLIGGDAPHLTAPGETWRGVKVISTSGEQAVVLVDGRQLTLRVGEAPASVGGPADAGGSDRVMLAADARGHFLTQGSINNHPVQFMVDTGASVIAISQSEADRLGLDYKKGRPVHMSTANGTIQGWAITLGAVRVGDMVTYDVSAVITPAPMATVLLGNSYLMRFNMRRDGDQMMLIKR